MSATIPGMGPVGAAERIAFLDVLRGFAVMAIFIVNIKAMAMPFAFYMNPSLWDSQLDQHIALVQKYLVDDKWRTTFTALYGAGLFMIWQRLDARGETRRILLRRNLWLALFGAVHLVGMWLGDILFFYGVTGLLAMRFVRMRSMTQLASGLVILAVGTIWMSVFAAGPAYSEELMAELKPMFWAPGAEEMQVEIDAALGGLGGQLLYRLQGAAGLIGFYYVLGGMLPVTLGLMVTGMALFRSGLYRGTWPLQVTVPVAIVALGSAWWLDWVQISALKQSGYSFVTYSLQTWMAALDGYLGALGYACLVSALVGLGARFSAVAAVGRMAFTNYIACTLIGTTLAGGHGLGTFGDVSLAYLMAVVIATFIGMLIWSPLWLRAFRFGPLEWLWRSLVYGRAQPLRRQATAAA